LRLPASVQADNVLLHAADRYMGFVASAGLSSRIEWTEDASKDDLERLARILALAQLIDEHSYPTVIEDGQTATVLNADDVTLLVPIGTDNGINRWKNQARPIPRALLKPIDDIFHRDVPYWQSPRFIENCGRDWKLARLGAADESPAGLADLSGIVRNQSLPFVVKVVSRQKAASLQFIETEEDRSEMFWAVMHLEGAIAAVQSHVEISGEYRFFVVDGRIYGHAIPEDRRTFIDSHEGIVPATVAAAADTLTKLMITDKRLGRSFSLDLFTSAAGGTHVMELNPLGPSGFFDTPPATILLPMIHEALRV